MRTLSLLLITVVLYTACTKEPLSSEQLVPTEQSSTIDVFEQHPQLQELILQPHVFRIADYWTEEKNLYDSLPNWVRDDLFEFKDNGFGYIKAREYHRPGDEFIERMAPFEMRKNVGGIVLTWVDINYEPKEYNIEYYTDSSFVVLFGNAERMEYRKYH